jgi:hypothetical protein
MLGADPSQSGPRFIILSGDSRFHLTLRGRAHYGICDFFCVQTILFETLYVFFVVRHADREILHVGVTRHPDSGLGSAADRGMLRLGPSATTIFDSRSR